MVSAKETLPALLIGRGGISTESGTVSTRTESLS